MLPLILTTGLAIASVSAMQQWGSLREAVSQGDSKGRVVLQEAATPGTFGLGALEGLKGEAIIVDGQAWVSRPREREGVARKAIGGEKATLLAVDAPEHWVSVSVEAGTGFTSIEQAVSGAVADLGLESLAARVFVIEAKSAEIDLHVINGYCPIKSLELPADNPLQPRRSHVTGGATIVGVYAPNGAGVITHHGDTLHMHALTKGENPVVGHIDSIRLPEGAVVRIGFDSGNDEE